MHVRRDANHNHFKNGHPITLELACGGGEYTLGLARMYPDRNFIGVDIKGARIWKGARVALADKLTNVGFLRTRIEVLSNFVDNAAGKGGVALGEETSI